jgi:cytochrome b involved in lipid metabolism
MEQKLNDLNHDYQRMRKLAKKRRLGILNRANKMRAKQEKEMQNKLGSESWVEVKGTWLEKVVWVLVGLLVGMWLH